MVAFLKSFLKPKFLLTALILLSGILPVIAQEEKEYNNQVWLDLNPRWVTNSGKIILAGSLAYRTIFPQDWNRYIVSLGVRYSPFIYRPEASIALQSLQFRAGIADYYTSSIVNKNLNEIRLYQGVRVKWPTFPRIHMSHYARAEERIEKVQDSETRDFTMRFRYRLTTEFHFIKPALTDLYLPFSVELFISGGEGLYFNDVTRITPGIGYDFTDQFSTEFQVSYHLSRNSNTDSFENNDLVFRLRVYFTF